ncbi:MAG TPA: SOS response-associated peptidase [Trueperaceae bacterium]
MCGRYTLWHGKRELDLLFEVAIHKEELSARYDIRPTQSVIIVRQQGTQRAWGSVRWGLVPSWVKDPQTFRTPLFNARAETLAEKPSFRTAFKRRRCLIPASGFYEWQGAKGSKQRHYIGRTDKEPLALAGLWESWERNGEAVESCTILTTRANKLMSGLHDRMPVILDPEHFDLWLDPDMQDTTILEGLLQPYPDGDLEAYPVGSYQGEDPRLIKRLNAEEAAGGPRA